MNNARVLENAVMTGTPQEVAEISKSLDMKEYANRALALACRFRGLEYVRAIVENDRTIKDANKPAANYWLALLDVKYAPSRKRLLAQKNLLHEDELEKEILPAKQRAEIVEYLCKHGENVLFTASNSSIIMPNNFFVRSIVYHNRGITAVLKRNGAAFTRYNIMSFMHLGRGMESKAFADFWNHLDSKEMIEVLQDIAAEMRSYLPTQFVYGFYKECSGHFLRPGFLEAVYKLCSKKGYFDKAVLINTAIDQNSIAHLEMFAENGWLKRPEIRDRVIAYAAETNKTECTAWLLDFKNSNFDLEAERRRAERKEHLELTSGPDSVYMLRKSWSFKKQEDGTVIITGYKGDKTKITVPSKIGRSVVTAIGGGAFSPRQENSGLTIVQIFTRRKITEVKLPDTLRSIGERAFYECDRLSETVIPDSVEEIGGGAFANCEELKTVVIPASVKDIGSDVFDGSNNVTVIAEANSFAEKYCKEHNIKFRYKE